MFNPFFNPYRVRRIDQGGIPTLDTIFSNVDTTNNTVTYGICPFQWRQLPCRGLILLNINHTATGATEGSLVSVATSVSSSQVSSNPTSVNTNSGKALLNGSGDQMPTEEISTGNKYLIYYDKRTGVFQIWLDRTTTNSKLKKKQQVSTMKKWRSVKIFQINQKHKQKFLQ